MPVLGGTGIVGLVDPGRQDDVLLAKQVTLFDPGSTEHVARALNEAASWVGATSVGRAGGRRRYQTSDRSHPGDGGDSLRRVGVDALSMRADVDEAP